MKFFFGFQKVDMNIHSPSLAFKLINYICTCFKIIKI